MKFERDVSYHPMEQKEDVEWNITFIPSGFHDVWLKIWDSCDYSFKIEYASYEENRALNKEKIK